jgi:2-dehydro-3-deoxy-L-rhamnonate dehydrogenase (NAD+)
MFDLNQHVAIVTGGAQGIGAAIARRLADAGASIAVADLNLDKAKGVADSLGHDSFAVETNVALPESVRNTLTEVLQRAGKVDILVNNAGIAGRAAPIWEQTDEDWQATIAVNITGVFNFCRAVLPHMRTQSYGRIVNVASIAGKEGNPRMVPYSATKAAVIALTKSVAKEVATDGTSLRRSRSLT